MGEFKKYGSTRDELQRLFTDVVKGLASQGYERSMLRSSCKVRGEHGRKCALGWLLPDDMYKPGLETISLAFRAVLDHPAGTGRYGQENYILAKQLQSFHDTSDTPGLMRERLYVFAANNGYVWPEGC